MLASRSTLANAEPNSDIEIGLDITGLEREREREREQRKYSFAKRKTGREVLDAHVIIDTDCSCVVCASTSPSDWQR